MARPKKGHREPPKSHPFHHPLWNNNRAYAAFQDTLRRFWDDKPYKMRRFEEWRLWSYWFELLEKCLN